MLCGVTPTADGEVSRGATPAAAAIVLTGARIDCSPAGLLEAAATLVICTVRVTFNEAFSPTLSLRAADFAGPVALAFDPVTGSAVSDAAALPVAFCFFFVVLPNAITHFSQPNTESAINVLIHPHAWHTGVPERQRS